MKDNNGDIQFGNVMELCLPRSDHVVDDGATGPVRPPLDLWEWQALRMGNYMLYLIDHHGFKHKNSCHHNSVNPISTLPHHVCCLYDIKMANMLCGNISIHDMD